MDKNQLKEHATDVVKELNKLDEVKRSALVMTARILAEIEEEKEQKGEELDANSERSGGVNPRREEA